jgi:hypothetical protein
MRIRSSNVFVALVVGALAVGAAPAAAETLTYSTPFAATVPHPCTESRSRSGQRAHQDDVELVG